MTVSLLRRVVSPDRVDAALRVIHLDLRRRGVTAGDLAAWAAVACPFPHLRFERPITSLAGIVAHALDLDDPGTLCEPQIVWHLPDDAPAGLDPWPHVDEEPPWAAGRKYARIAGVALTEWTRDNGTLRVWREGRAEPVEMQPGDVVAMHPGTQHSAGVNRTGRVRVGVYFRWLGE